MMKRFVRYVLTALTAVSLSASCAKDDAEVIPRGKLARIYAEMLVTDQWVLSTPGVRTIADTSLVYEPILKKYGYDSEDYRKSIDVYMDDPERFARIFRETGEILERRLKHLKKEQERLRKEKQKEIEAQKFRTDFKPEEFFPYIFEEPYVHYYDSVSFVPDSALMVYRLVPVETSDTLYSGLEMIVHADTLSLSDTSSLGEVAAARDSVGNVVDATGIRHEIKSLKKLIPEAVHLKDNLLKKDGDK